MATRRTFNPGSAGLPDKPDFNVRASLVVHCCCGDEQEPDKRGLEPVTLKLEVDWIDNIKKSMQKKKPAGGWPHPK